LQPARLACKGIADCFKYPNKTSVDNKVESFRDASKKRAACTDRVGAVYEESRLPLRHWAYAFWRAPRVSKSGQVQVGCLSW